MLKSIFYVEMPLEVRHVRKVMFVGKIEVKSKVFSSSHAVIFEDFIRFLVQITDIPGRSIPTN